MSRTDADLIIAGAGCAGLSALSQILDRPARNRRIIVIDRDIGPKDDRTWAFWGTDDSPFAHLADRRWDSVRVRFPGWETTATLRGTARAAGRRHYVRVRRRDYDQEILDRAAAHRNVHIVAQPITDIRDDADGATVVLPEGELRAPLVFQSARLSPDDHRRPVRHPLRQHFGGWEVHTQHPVFDPGVVTLMDFDTDQHDATTFFYVLPEAPDRALVEHTMFSLEPKPRDFYDGQIRAHLDRLGAGEVTVTRTEYGSIPMEDRRPSQRWGSHVWNLGTAGGMTKPTSGYTFQRIHAQTSHLVAAWAAGETLRPLPAAPRRFGFADRTLLHLLHHHPGQGRPVFERLFRTTAIDDVLTFLDQDTTLAADARMFSRLPWVPFLRSAAAESAAGMRSATRRLVAS